MVWVLNCMRNTRPLTGLTFLAAEVLAGALPGLPGTSWVSASATLATASLTALTGLLESMWSRPP